MLEPIEPELRLPREPTPSFTLRFHDAVGRCSKGHTFSARSWDLNVAYFFGGDRSAGDDTEPKDWPACNDHLCPHCEREKWRGETIVAGQQHNKALTKYRRERRRYDEFCALAEIDGFGAF